jgi:hypothetical protein
MHGRNEKQKDILAGKPEGKRSIGTLPQIGGSLRNRE